MYEFIEYVLWELKNSFGLVILAGIASTGILAATWLIHRKKYKGTRKYPWGRAMLYLILVGYLAIVVYATLLRGFGFHREWNLHLFRAWREAWNNYSVKNWANVLLNVAMFIPLSFLLPLLWKRFRKWYICVPTGFLVSLAIELFQLAIGRGICDVDDLFANTLGAVIGYLLVMTGISISGTRGKRLKPVLTFGCLFLVCVCSIGSIFVVYELQEYGNLPMAPAYTNNTQGVEWSLDCELPDVEECAAIYRNQTRSLAACDAFAEAFAEIIGTEYDSTQYYQEAAYYMDHGSENGAHFLQVSYMDMSFDYSAIYDIEAVWADADRKALEDALSVFPVLIPAYAEFTAEGDGWHSFTVNQYIDGDVMIDGELRVRYADDGTIREIENNLLSYTYCNEVPIISPEEALERLYAGQFYDGGFFEHKAPGDVTVFSCALEYEIDTKGFYQPVYYFDVASEDGNYQDYIMIPAMK